MVPVCAAVCEAVLPQALLWRARCPDTITRDNVTIFAARFASNTSGTIGNGR